MSRGDEKCRSEKICYVILSSYGEKNFSNDYKWLLFVNRNFTCQNDILNLLDKKASSGYKPQILFWGFLEIFIIY